MDQVITFTLEEVWHLILAICGGITAISAAVAVIVKLVQKARHPNKRQNERLNALEEENKKRQKEIEDIKERLEQGTKQFEEEDQRTRELEEDIKATIRMIIEGLQALTAHAIDGANIDELRKAKKNLDSFLLKQI